MTQMTSCFSPYPSPGEESIHHQQGYRRCRRYTRFIRAHASTCILGTLLAFVFSLSALGQAHDSRVFPRDFAGHWKGTLQWYPSDKPVQSVEMQLIIQPLDTPGRYSWRMVYGKPGQDERPYTLMAVDSAKGHWVVDEHNGILLDGYWRGNRFTSVFSVQGTVISEVMWLENEALQVEFITHGEVPVRESGGSVPEIPRAKSFPVRGYQRATLYRNK